MENVRRNLGFPNSGFTIAELLIALLILGEIATFTIPKIIYAQQTQRFNAVIKEDLATVSQAIQLITLNGQLSSSMTSGALTQYMNYLALDTSSQIDDAYGYAGSQTCSATQPCAKMANGSYIMFANCTFGGTSQTNNVVEMFMDPDGRVTSGGGATTDGKSVRAFIYYSGRTVSWSGVTSGTGSSCYPWGPGTDPPYLQY